MDMPMAERVRRELAASTQRLQAWVQGEQGELRAVCSDHVRVLRECEGEHSRPQPLYYALTFSNMCRAARAARDGEASGRVGCREADGGCAVQARTALRPLTLISPHALPRRAQEGRTDYGRAEGGGGCPDGALPPTAAPSPHRRMTPCAGVSLRWGGCPHVWTR